MVALHEAEGTWGVAAYLTLMNKGVAPNDVLPFVYCTFTVLNHSKAEKNIEQGTVLSLYMLLFCSLLIPFGFSSVNSLCYPLL